MVIEQKNASQKKTYWKNHRKVIKKTAGWMRPDLTFKTSTLAFTKLSLEDTSSFSLCGGDDRK